MHHLVLTIGMWFEWWTGVTNTWWYAWWSGFGSDLSEWAGLFAGFAVLGKHLNCKRKGCWRIGWHNIVDPDTGERVRLCRHCHPHHDHITAEHIADIAHRIHLHRQRRETGSDQQV